MSWVEAARGAAADESFFIGEWEIPITTASLFCFVWLVVAAPTFLVCIAWFVARRERQPIRARLPLLVAAINLGMLVYIGAACLEKILDVRYVCGASLWVDFAGLIVMGNLYIIRAWVLFFRHEQAAEFLRVHDGMVAETRDIRQRAMAPGGRRLDVRKYNGLLARSVSQGALKAHSRPDGTGPTSPKAAGGGGGGGMAEAARRLQSLRAEGSAYSFARRRDLVDSRFLTRMMVAVTLLLLVFPLVYSLADRDYVRKKSADCDEGVPLVMFPIYALLYICIFAVAAAKISHIADAFFIATELRLTAAVALVAAVVWTVFQFAPVLKDWNDDHFPVSTLMVLLVAAACLALSIAWPLYRSYVNPPQATIASAEKLETLSELLKIEEAARAFKEFLVTEFSVENLLFWQDVEDIRAEALNGGDNPEELDSIIAPIARAKIIMVLHRFVVADAPFAINLPSEIGQPLRAALPNLEAVRRESLADLVLPESADASSLQIELVRASSSQENVADGGDGHAAESDEKQSDAEQPMLPDASRSLVIETLRHLLAAQRNIYGLMSTDSFTRWRRSPQFEAFAADYIKRRNEYKAFERAKIV